MSAESRRLLAHMIARRWPIHIVVVAGYAFAMIATAHEWYAGMWVYYFAAMLGLFRVDEGALLVARGVRLLPLSTGERERLLWMWVFLAPLGVLALLLTATALISGLLLDHSIVSSARIALYLAAPFSLALLASRFPQTRAVASMRMVAALVFLVAAVSDLARAAPSKPFLIVAFSLVVLGLSFPIWARVTVRESRRTHETRTLALANTRWPTGVVAMVLSRVRASIPSMLVMTAFIVIVSAFSIRHRESLATTISIMSLVVMGYIWMSNWRWLCHFRALRCLPLSTRQLTALTLGVSVIPSTTVWIVQYIVTGWLLSAAPLSVTSLLALIAVQLLTVPVFLYAPGWLRLNWLAALVPTVFLALQSLVGIVGLEQFRPWVESRSQTWIVAFVGALVACAIAAIVWTYREIADGRHAYRVQTDDWAPPTWAWPE